MRHRFGEAFTKLPIERIGPGSSFMREFEGFKKDFSESSYEVHSLRLVMPGLDPNYVNTTIYDADYGDVKLSRWVDNNPSATTCLANDLMLETIYSSALIQS